MNIILLSYLIACHNSNSSNGVPIMEDHDPNCALGQDIPTYDPLYTPMVQEILPTQLDNNIEWIKENTAHVILAPNEAYKKNKLFIRAYFD